VYDITRLAVTCFYCFFIGLHSLLVDVLQLCCIAHLRHDVSVHRLSVWLSVTDVLWINGAR